MNQDVGDGIGVQIDGDGNTVIVYAGRARLALSRPHARRKAEPQTELELLRVDIRATALVGRAAELADLDAWLASPRPIAFRCLTARAGTGKTRLGVELCERAEAAGWTAGFAQYGPFPEFVKVAGDWQLKQPTLVVVDYAASLARDIRAWIEILAVSDRFSSTKKLRILLLERHADKEQGWWSDLVKVTSFSAPGPADFADPLAPIALRSLGVLEDRRALLAETMRHAGRIAGRADALLPPAPGESPDFDRRLVDDRHDNEPLYLMMAGTEAALSAVPAAMRLARTELAERAAGRESARLGRLAAQWGLPEPLLVHLALCVTLQGGCGFEAALELVRAECEAMSLAVSLPPTDVVDRLAEAMPVSTTGEIDGMRPDLIGEAFVLTTMRTHKRYPQTETGIVDRAAKRAPGNVAATLVRAAQDFAHGDAAHDSVRWLDRIIRRSDDLDELFAVTDAIPAATLALRESAVGVSNRLVAVFRSLPSQPEDLKPYFASILNNLAGRLSDVGKREAALDAAREAVDIRRALAAQRPDAFTADLAASLSTLAIMLRDVGQREAALDAARAALDIRRQLAEQWPNAFRPDLALSLNNLVGILSDVGQRVAALDAAREAVDIRRELAAQRPDVFQPYLAQSLTNLVNVLGEVGQREAALDAARQAVEIYCELAAQHPDACRPNLARSLTNLANRLSEVGQREAALDAARQAVAIRRQLAAQRPDAFRPELALSLNNLANRLSEVAQHEAALDVAREAVSVYRDLAVLRPDAFRPYLAPSLKTLAAMLRNVGQSEAALDAAREAVDIRRELATQRPDAFLPDLAGSLNSLAAMLNEVGQHEAALDAARESVSVYFELAAQRPDALRPDLAASLNNLAVILSAGGQREAALDAAREAVSVYRDLAAQRPDTFRPDFARSLAQQATCLQALDFADEALASDVDAISTLAAPFFLRPSIFADLMAKIARHYLAHCEQARREPDADLLNPIIMALNALNGGTS